MKTQYYITAGMVRERGACDYGQETFERVFGHGKVLLTRENVRKALEHDLPVRWPALKLRNLAPAGSALENRADWLYTRLLDAEYDDDADKAYKLLHETASLFNEHRKALRS